MLRAAVDWGGSNVVLVLGRVQVGAEGEQTDAGPEEPAVDEFGSGEQVLCDSVCLLEVPADGRGPIGVLVLAGDEDQVCLLEHNLGARGQVLGDVVLLLGYPGDCEGPNGVLVLGRYR